MPRQAATEKVDPAHMPVVTGNAGLPATIYDEMEAAQDSDFSKSEMIVPRLRVAQDLTPQTKKNRAEYIPGLEPGYIFNTVTNEFWPGETGGIIVVPAAFRVTYTEWVPRKQGGGFVADRSEDEGIEEYWEDLRRKMREKDPTWKGGKPLTEEGNELVKAYDYYVLRIEPETGLYEEAVMTIGGTQVGKARRWNTVMEGRRLRRSDGTPFKPMIYAFAYRILTQPENNEQGDWYGLVIGKADVGENTLGETLRFPYGKGIYEAASRFRNLVLEGKKRAAFEHDDDHDDGVGKASGRQARDLEDEIPF